jgi:7-dehydrocholesterol reductase
MLQPGPLVFFREHFPQTDSKVNFSYAGWLALQVALYRFLPSKISTGQLTPSGNLLQYRTNGLFAWIVTHGLFMLSVLCGLFDASIIVRPV